MYIRTLLRTKIMNSIKGENIRIRCIWKGSLSAHPKLKIEFEFIDPKIPPKNSIEEKKKEAKNQKFNLSTTHRKVFTKKCVQLVFTHRKYIQTSN